jgi:hypothetical protein
MQENANFLNAKCALKQLLKKFACGLADGYTLVGINKNQE